MASDVAIWVANRRIFVYGAPRARRIRGPVQGGSTDMTDRERAHRDAMRTDIASIAERLQDVLGQRLTAYAVGVRDPKSIGRYAKGPHAESGQKPRDDTDYRLRQLYQIVQMLVAQETSETVRAWFLGANPLLEDRSPIELLHEDDSFPVERTAAADTRPGYFSVVTAAEDFVQSG